MPFEKRVYKKFNKRLYASFILGADIGGTNTNLGVFGVKKNFPTLLISFHFKSQQLKGLHSAINEALIYVEKSYGIGITKACFGVAGVLSSNKENAKITNINWDVSKNILLKKTKLKKILLINDFEAVGYGINMLTKRDVAIIKKAKKAEKLSNNFLLPKNKVFRGIPKAPIVVVGAGTGLGKTTLIYDEHYKSYIPLPSEAGHSDFAAQTKEELELVNFIKKNKKIKANIPFEEVLSGRGLSNIYLFLRKSGKFKETKYTKEINKSKYQPELISKYKKVDKTCKETFKIFKIIYAKFAKNFALDVLPYGGIYIAGGIAPKNKDIFDKNFIKTFENNYKLSYVLKKIPIYLVLNSNAGLIGAGFAGTKIFK